MTSIRLATYNLRYDSQPDHITVKESLGSLPDPLDKPRSHSNVKEHPWSLRRLRVAQELRSANIAIAGLQEALIRQVLDLAELLGDDFAWFGVGRDDGVTAGEFSPIFYKMSQFQLVESDSFWLSLTPFKPSKFPKAGSFRVCTMTVLRAVSTSETFVVFNTHLDDQSDQQRQLGASLLLARARYESHVSGLPVILLGDFNSPGSGKDSSAYEIIAGLRPPVEINAEFAQKFAVPGSSPPFKFFDLRSQAPRQNISTNFATFTGFTSSNNVESWKRIDFIFGCNTGRWSTESYAVGNTHGDDGILPSDHRPVYADVTLL